MAIKHVCTEIPDHIQGAMLKRLPSVPGMGEAVPWSRLQQTMDSRHILSHPCLVLPATGAMSVADIRSELAVDEFQGRDDLSCCNRRRSLNKSHHWFGACLR
jgi:hypothetical protein